MKETLKYELKRCIPFFPIVLVCGITLFLMYFLIMSPSVDNITYFVGFYASISILIFIFYNFGYNKKKISLDLYYALPISHKQLFIAKYLFTLIEILIEFIILLAFTYLYIQIANVSQTKFSNSELLNIFFIILTQLVFSIGFLNIFLLLFNISNNYSGAVLYMIIASLIPLFFFLDLCNIMETNYIKVSYGLFYMLSSWCRYLVYGIAGYASGDIFIFNLSSILIVVGLCYLSFIPLYLYTINNYAENVELPDKKIYGYKLLVPILFILLIFYFAYEMKNDYIFYGLIILAIIILFQYIIYLIFEKTLKISKFSLISLAVTIVIGIIIMFM